MKNTYRCLERGLNIVPKTSGVSFPLAADSCFSNDDYGQPTRPVGNRVESIASRCHNRPLPEAQRADSLDPPPAVQSAARTVLGRVAPGDCSPGATRPDRRRTGFPRCTPGMPRVCSNQSYRISSQRSARRTPRLPVHSSFPHRLSYQLLPAGAIRRRPLPAAMRCWSSSAIANSTVLLTA